MPIFRWVEPLARGKRNDRDQLTSTDLYLNRGDYFSEGEVLGSDGGFKGDGPILISYDTLDTAEKSILISLLKK